MGQFVVAGATGHTGCAVAQELLAARERVTVIVRDRERAAPLAKAGARLAVGSLDDRAFINAALRGGDGFFAILPEDPATQDFHGGRRRMADVVAGAVADQGVPHVVLMSAIAASLEEGNGPASDLHYFEDALRRTGTTLTALRATWLQENVGAALQPAMQGGIYPNFLPSADAPFPTVAAADVGRIAAAILREGAGANAVVDVLGPVYTVRQIAGTLGAALKKELRVVDIPAAAHVPSLMQAGLSKSFAEAVAELYRCLGHGKVKPEGDRVVTGTTTLAEVVRGMLQPVA